MTSFRETALTLQFLCGIYKYILQHIPLPKAKAFFEAGRQAMQCSEEEKKVVELNVMAMSLRDNPEAIKEVFKDNPSALAVALGQGPRPPMDEQQRIRIIEALLTSFIEAPMLATHRKTINRKALEIIVGLAQEIAMREEGVTKEEFKEIFDSFCQPIIEVGIPAWAERDPTRPRKRKKK